MSSFGEGAIVRIKLENFLTYDSVEFYPGPSLNVIIGPNGTGKSTIVCAICLGLAGKTNVLGRALQLMEYIKHGQSKAVIEIELNKQSGDNYVIRREIQKDNTNRWSINGKNATLKSVEEMVQRLNIQVGNLCQFLPQDKVADFAKMTQQELLENTQKAVGPPEMFERHQRLKVARERERELELSFNRGQEQLGQETAANARLEQDVNNYQQKKRHMEKIQQLQMKRPWVEYEEKRKEFQAAKDVKDSLINQVKAARSQNGPLQKRADVAKKRIQQLEVQMKKLGENVKDHARRATDCNKNLENRSDQVQEVTDELLQKRQDDRKRQEKLKDLNEKLTSLEATLEASEEEDIQPALDQVTKEMTTLTREMSRMNQAVETVRIKVNNTRRDITGYQGELRDLQDINTRRLDELRRRHKDTYDAVQWLRANRHLFKGQIYEPMMIIINMKDPAMAKYLETHISFNDMRAFVYEVTDDMELFMNKMRTEQKLRVNMVEAPAQAAASYQPQHNIDKYKRYGFHHYLRDMFDCPEAVMRYLCARYHVHQIPVGDRQTKNRVEEIIASVKELQNFYTENHQYNVKYSRYSKAKSTRCTELKKPSLLALAFNSEREREVKQELQAKQDELGTMEAELRRLDQKFRESDTHMNELRSRKKELMNRKNVRRQLEQQINMKRDSIKRLESEAMDLEAEEQDVKSKIDVLLKKKCEILKDLQDETRKCQDLSEDKVRQSIKYAASFQEQQTVEEELREQSFSLRNMERDLEKQKDVVKTLKDKAMEVFEAAKKSCKLGKNEDLSDDIKQVFDILPNTLEKIDAAIHEEQARADCTFHTDENVVKEYQNREKQINRLTTDIKQREEALHKHRTDIEETKAQWLDPLKQLIDKINTNFSHFFQCMKCAGEVDLFVPENPEDYEKYGIRIKVLFRSSEELRELTPHHQSGGERSVSTVLYMMALQELTRVPFRCVDEINQGMDPQNERKVFELVVQTACSLNSSQYFLLTPKLLPDLTYSDNMTILCVYNGPYMVDHTKWSMAKFSRRRARFN